MSIEMKAAKCAAYMVGLVVLWFGGPALIWGASGVMGAVIVFLCLSVVAAVFVVFWVSFVEYFSDH
jgi:membrane protein implicated in regulation of membrane protease activity